MIYLRFVSVVVGLALTLAGSSSSAAEPVRTVAAGFHGDVEFGHVGGVSLTLDAFVPEEPGLRPTCIFVHGGGFTKGDKQSYIKPLFEPVGKAGFTWFTINYRLAPEHRWPACSDDVATAVRWVREHAAEYRVDPDRIALVGESAGGHLVSWSGAHGQGPTRVAAVVSFYAPHDLEWRTRQTGMIGPSISALLGVSELNDDTYQRLRDISPYHQLRPGLPPYLLIHGDADVQVAFEQSPRFQEKMKSLGNTCDLIKVSGGAHGMGGWAKLGSDYQQQMIEWLRKTMR